MTQYQKQLQEQLWQSLPWWVQAIDILLLISILSIALSLPVIAVSLWRISKHLTKTPSLPARGQNTQSQATTAPTVTPEELLRQNAARYGPQSSV